MQLADLFMQARSNVVEWQGLQVYSMYKWTTGGSFLLHFDTFVKSPVQGVRLETDGRLRIGEVEGSGFVLWADTSPADTVIELVSKGPCVIDIANVWRAPGGRMDSWIGDAGMLVNDTNGRVAFRCNGAVGPPAFKDLEFIVRELGR